MPLRKRTLSPMFMSIVYVFIVVLFQIQLPMAGGRLFLRGNMCRGMYDVACILHAYHIQVASRGHVCGSQWRTVPTFLKGKYGRDCSTVLDVCMCLLPVFPPLRRIFLSDFLCRVIARN